MSSVTEYQAPLEDLGIDPRGDRFLRAIAAITLRLETLEWLESAPSSPFYERWQKRHRTACGYLSVADVEEFAQSLLTDCRVAHQNKHGQT